MGNAGLTRAPPIDTLGTAVLYIRGFSYHTGDACSCSESELCSTASGGSATSLAAGSVPQELAGCAIIPQEFAAGAGQLNAKAKGLIAGGKTSLYALGCPGCCILLAITLIIAGLAICDDPSPKDYWRVECWEMEADCGYSFNV